MKVEAHPKECGARAYYLSARASVLADADLLIGPVRSEIEPEPALSILMKGPFNISTSVLSKTQVIFLTLSLQLRHFAGHKKETCAFVERETKEASDSSTDLLEVIPKGKQDVL